MNHKPSLLQVWHSPNTDTLPAYVGFDKEGFIVTVEVSLHKPRWSDGCTNLGNVDVTEAEHFRVQLENRVRAPGPVGAEGVK